MQPNQTHTGIISEQSFLSVLMRAVPIAGATCAAFVNEFIQGGLLPEGAFFRVREFILLKDGTIWIGLSGLLERKGLKDGQSIVTY